MEMDKRNKLKIHVTLFHPFIFAWLSENEDCALKTGISPPTFHVSVPIGIFESGLLTVVQRHKAGKVLFDAVV